MGSRRDPTIGVAPVGCKKWAVLVKFAFGLGTVQISAFEAPKRQRFMICANSRLAPGEILAFGLGAVHVAPVFRRKLHAGPTVFCSCPRAPEAPARFGALLRRQARFGPRPEDAGPF